MGDTLLQTGTDASDEDDRIKQSSRDVPSDMRRRWLLGGAVVALFAAGVVIGVVLNDNGAADQAQGITAEQPIEYDVERDPDVPALPFDDNPDPAQCGIPVQWGENGRAWLSGIWEGELIQSEVLVYNSHLRTSVTGGAPHGTEVQIVLFQENPVLDYYFVKIPGDTPQEGWVPEPFLSFEPVT
jgi:hypothetical protein